MFVGGSSVKPTPKTMETKMNSNNVVRFVTYKPEDYYNACNATVFTIAVTADDDKVEANGDTKLINALRKASKYHFKCIANTPDFNGAAMTKNEACRFLKSFRLYREVGRLTPESTEIIYKDELRKHGIGVDECEVSGQPIFRIDDTPFIAASPKEEIGRASWLIDRINAKWSYHKTRATLVAYDLVEYSSGQPDKHTKVTLTPIGDVRIDHYKYQVVREVIDTDM